MLALNNSKVLVAYGSTLKENIFDLKEGERKKALIPM